MAATLTIGVIGHVDHGKTALVRALTGIETDRLAEERRRGISIALGFAHLTLGGVVLDLIDMPGHERFLRTMIAGATGISAVMLVVAANEGVGPQTLEHAEIAALLGVRQAVIAVSKSDLAAPARVAEVGAAAAALVSRLGLAADPPVAVSSTRGTGLAPLRQALGGLAARAQPAADRGVCYLPIDRSFSVAGHGTVVTGTLRGGAIATGDELDLAGRKVRMRGVQVRGTTVPVAAPGQRVAVNLRGVELAAARRGLALAAPGLLVASSWLTVELRAADAPLPTGTRARLLHGTAEAEATVRLLDRDVLEPGQSGPAQLRCTPRISVPAGERLILRQSSPPRVVGGGRVLDPEPPRLRRNDPPTLARVRTLARESPEAIVAAMLARAGSHGIAISVPGPSGGSVGGAGRGDASPVCVSNAA